jgi:hypothetical protein
MLDIYKDYTETHSQQNIKRKVLLLVSIFISLKVDYAANIMDCKQETRSKIAPPKLQ